MALSQNRTSTSIQTDWRSIYNSLNCDVCSGLILKGTNCFVIVRREYLGEGSGCYKSTYYYCCSPICLALSQLRIG